MARRARQSSVILCTGWARMVDDAEDVVDSRAVVEKQRPIRCEAVEQFVECGLSGTLGLVINMPSRPGDFFGSRFRLR